MFSYFIRRILLIPPTLFLITLLVFSISRLMPGGPMERILQQAVLSESESNSSSDNKSSSPLSEKDLEEVEELFGLDKPIVVAYFQWLGLWPKETHISKKELDLKEEKTEEKVILKGIGKVVSVTSDGSQILSTTYSDGSEYKKDGWTYRLESEEDRQKRYRKRNRLTDEQEAPGYNPRIVLYKKSFSGLFQGEFGNSILYGDSVLSIILARVPIAAYFGILSAFITYSISLPLGILKAIKHRTPIDAATSVLIFFGYSIPGFALGAILVIWLGAQLELFPLFGLTSADFHSMSLADKAKDLAHHTVLPLLCYIVGGFAYLTMMMKNNLMDNLAADYVKTAVSRGASFPKAVFGHAFKNSLIPIATSLGQLITIFVSGSMLVERVFDIQGFGLLQFNSVISLDVPVIMGTLTISSLLVLLGNILSDFIVASIDPRIKFS